MKKYQWVIIGGGIHGIGQALYLRAKLNLPSEQMLIIDKHEQALTRWRAFTGHCHMQHMRSPVTHHLHPHKWALVTYLKQKDPDWEKKTVPPKLRPLVEDFNNFHEELFQHYGLGLSWLTGEVQEISLIEKASTERLYTIVVHIPTKEGLQTQEIRAENIIVATGAGAPHYPSFVDSRYEQQHIFSPNYQDKTYKAGEKVLVIGAGASGGQLALWLIQQGCVVDMFGHWPMQGSPYDFDPGYIGPKKAKLFYQASLIEREKINQENRFLGTMPLEIKTQLDHWEQTPQFHYHTTSIESLEKQAQGWQIQTIEGQRFQGQDFLLATGIKEPVFPRFLNTIAQKKSLGFYQQFPILNQYLQWSPENIYFSGFWASLFLGPFSNNIVGAQRAAIFIHSKKQKMLLEKSMQAVLESI